ncbi:hypothetical protein Mapa_011239 [Marchantia paleacea]|nr:hypothetical protein Mapa_011239 [Marchantia paleacea]
MGSIDRAFAGLNDQLYELHIHQRSLWNSLVTDACDPQRTIDELRVDVCSGLLGKYIQSAGLRGHSPKPAEQYSTVQQVATTTNEMIFPLASADGYRFRYSPTRYAQFLVDRYVHALRDLKAAN